MCEWTSIFREVEHSYAAWDEYDFSWERHLEFCYGTPETLKGVLDELVKRHGSARLGLLSWFPLFCPRNWEELEEILGPNGQLESIGRNGLPRLVRTVPARAYNQTIAERAEELFQWSCDIERDLAESQTAQAVRPAVTKEGWDLYLADLASAKIEEGDDPQLSKYALYMMDDTVEILPLLKDQQDFGIPVATVIFEGLEED